MFFNTDSLRDLNPTMDTIYETPTTKIEKLRYSGPPRQNRPLVPGNDYAVKHRKLENGKVMVTVLDDGYSFKIKYKSEEAFEKEWIYFG